MNRHDELISRYLDGGLTPEETIELKYALDVDPTVTDQLLEYYRQDRLLATLLRPASADAVNRVMDAVSAEDSFVDSVMQQARTDAIDNAQVRRAVKRTADPANDVDRVKQPAAMSFADWLQRSITRPRLTTAIATVALLGLLVWLFPPANNAPTLAVSMGTRVSLERDGQSFSAPDGLSLAPGDLLRISGSNGAAITYGGEQTSVVISNEAELKVLSWKQGKRFELHDGVIEASATRQRPFRPMRITTPQADARVLGTRFTLAVTTNATRLDVTEGKVKFTLKSDQQSVKVSAGQYAVASVNYELSALPATGGIQREWWTGVKGKTRFNLSADPRFPNQPDSRDTTPDFELTIPETNQLAVRFCGYVHPPVTGDYNFWLERPPPDFGVVGYACLMMSPSESPSEAVLIAQTGGGTLLAPYVAAGMTEAPPPIPLVAGRRYYIEARILIGQGKGQLSIAWKPPGRSREVLSGKFLSPWKPK